MAQPPRPEDFGAVPVAAGLRPEDFGAVAVSQPPPMTRIGNAAVKGFMRGSLPMAAFDTAREGSAITGELYGRTAYKAGEKVTDALSGIGAPAPVAAGGGFAANVGMQAIPSLLAYGAGSGLTQAAAQPVARGLMKGAVKASPKHTLSGKADQAIDTMLEKGINVSMGGVTKLQKTVSGLEDDISNILAKSPATVDKYAVAATLRDAWSKVQKELSPTASMEKVMESFHSFINHPLLQGGSRIPVELANQLKQTAYKKLGDAAYGPGVVNPATAIAEKTLARGLRENIARAEPSVVPLLKEQSDAVNVLKVMGNRAATETKNNPFGIGLLAENPLAAGAFAIDRSSLLKSLLARGMYSASPPLGGLLGSYTAAQQLNQKK